MTTSVEQEMAVPRSNVGARRTTRRRRTNVWTWVGAPAIAYVVLAFAVPMVYVVVQSFTDPSPATYADAVQSDLFRRSLTQTFKMAVVVTLLSLLVSYPYAYVMARSGPLLRGVLTASVVVSFWTSFLVRTFAWQVLLGNSGLVNKAILGMGLSSQPVTLLHTDFAVDLAMVHILAPFQILAIFAQLRSVPPDLERAAQSMGARPSVAFWRVTFPLSLPGAFAGAVLVFVMALGFYVTPSILGDSARFYLGQVVVLEVQRFYETGTAAAMSLILLAIVVIVLGIAARFVGLRRLLGITSGGDR